MDEEGGDVSPHFSSCLQENHANCENLVHVLLCGENPEYLFFMLILFHQFQPKVRYLNYILQAQVLRRPG